MAPSDIEIATVELHEIAQHAYNLAMGLQNVAPSQVTAGMSIQYLRETSIELEKMHQQILELSSGQKAKEK